MKRHRLVRYRPVMQRLAQGDRRTLQAVWEWLRMTAQFHGVQGQAWAGHDDDQSARDLLYAARIDDLAAELFRAAGAFKEHEWEMKSRLLEYDGRVFRWWFNGRPKRSVLRTDR